MAQEDDEGNSELTPDAGDGPAVRRTTFTPASPDAYAEFAANESVFSPAPVDAPPPHPSTLVTPPPGSGLPVPPQRRSLGDAELFTSVVRSDGGSLEAIEKLQAQLRMREQEAREFRNWESSMLAIGSAEALEIVEETRVTFTGAIQVIPTASTPAASTPAASTPAASAPLIVDDSITDVAPPMPPVESPRTAPGDIVLVAEEADRSARLFQPETAGVEPPLPEQRTGTAFRLFWLWFAANSSVLSVIFGAMLLALGMSLRQAVLATLAGVALSFLPVGLATLASKWNGQPTIVASRAAFGVIGNVVPAVFSLVTRLLWGAVLLWLFASVNAQLLHLAGAGGGLSVAQLTIASAGAGFLLAQCIAFFGYRLLRTVQMVLSVASALLVIVVVVTSWHRVDLDSALTINDGPWALVLTGAILVFSFIGLVWSTSAGDLARYQKPARAGAVSMLSASFGNALPAFVLIVYGALLAASDPAVAAGFAEDPIVTLSEIVPVGLLSPLIVAVGIGLLSGVTLSIYTLGFTVAAIAPIRRDLAVLVGGVALGAIAIVFALVAIDLTDIFRDLTTTLGVPIAAWLGVFAADVMIRNRRFDTRSLVQRGGVYPDVNWVNLAILVLAGAVGYGFTTASASWLAWQGYLLELVAVAPDSELGGSDFGVLVALGLALVAALSVNIPAVRRQEAKSN